MKYSTILNCKLLIYCSVFIINIQYGDALLSDGKNNIISSAKVKQLIDKEVEKELQSKSKQYEEKITELENNIKLLEEKKSTTGENTTNTTDNITLCAIQDDNKTKMRWQVLKIQKQLEQVKEQNKNSVIQIISQLDYQKSNDRNKAMQQKKQLHESIINNNSNAVSVMDNNITEMRNSNVWYKFNEANIIPTAQVNNVFYYC